MNKLLHAGLIAEVNRLRKITNTLSIESIINFVVMEQRRFNEGDVTGEHLSSPLKQGMYLLAIASNQPEPIDAKAIDEKKHSYLIKTLNSIFNKYALAYFPEKGQHIEGLNSQWHLDRQVSMPAFLRYFTSGFNISTHKIKSWIEFYYSDFDEQIRAHFGISYKTMIDVGNFFEDKISENYSNIRNTIENIDLHRNKYMDMLEKDYQSAILQIRSDENLALLMESFYNGTNEIHSINTLDLTKAFDENVKESILTHFTTQRGHSDQICYITDDNPVIKKPIFTVDGEKLYFVLNNSFYQSIINNIESHLSKGNLANSFLKARDRKLEEKTVTQFKRLLPKNAEFYESAFENDKAHFEHDLIIVHDDRLFIVEAKASPPREPLRDPSKAFIRIRDHFKSNAGIQKAYNQAHALEKNLIANGQVELYDRKGKKLTVLDYAKLKKIYCICVTRDDFGAMATDLSLLLEKDEDFAYPWAVNITDLEFMIDGLLHLDMNHEKFYQYLEQRRLIHGKVFGLDELEYAGAFLKYNGLDKFITAEADFIPLDISESDIFDDIYFAELNGEKMTIEHTDPELIVLDRERIFKFKKTQKNKKDRTKRKAARKARRNNR
ncbi:NERD domain-containing protein [Aeromonas veronii]|uniref:nuclease-related domain-containing protein n=1 Tax=Aeromonas TaxID=642 RepID=UPI00188D664A|nr:nuclease-related domain-containing protein [Aeromonas veronii]MBF3237940.1 NERD domain-containing protein [Aeromonas veronii]